MNQGNYEPPQSDITPGLTEESDEDDLAAYIGPRNTEYYLERYRRIENGRALGWNWPAFFLTGAWLLYRKMWPLAVAYIIVLPIAVVLLVALVANLVGDAAGYAVLLAYLATMFLIIPAFVNKLYLSRARALIDRVNAAGFEDERRRRIITNSGGTSIAGVIVFAVMMIPVAGTFSAISIPAYQDYTIRAQVAEGLSLAAVVQSAVNEYYEAEQSLPFDNAEAGLEDAVNITGTYVDSVAVESGTIIVTFGGGANSNIAGTSIYWQPEPLRDGRLEWSCGRGQLPQRWVPSYCR